MTDYSIVPTSTDGVTIYTDSWWNTYLRDNCAALWRYTAAGDFQIAASPTTLTAIAKPASTKVATMDGSKVFAWAASNTLPGMLHTSDMQTWEHDQSISGGWVDITYGTSTLTLTKTCTIFVAAGITGYNALRYSAGGAYLLRININGVDDSAYAFNGGITGGRNEALPWLAMALHVPSGSRTIQLQANMSGETDNIADGRLLALAFVE